MGRLTTHVLDTVHGGGASGVKVDVFRLDEQGRASLLASAVTNADGRTDQPLLAGDGFLSGRYELLFHVGAYFVGRGVRLSEPRFLDQVPVRFGVADSQVHCHVPLLVAPWSYTTYRGG